MLLPLSLSEAILMCACLPSYSHDIILHALSPSVCCCHALSTYIHASLEGRRGGGGEEREKVGRGGRRGGGLAIVCDYYHS